MLAHHIPQRSRVAEKTSVTEPSVAIIILNWNSLEWTRRCLEAITGISYRNFEVFLVDNASENDEGETLVREFGNSYAVVRNPSNLGFAEGNNRLILEAIRKGFAYVLLLNNDVELTSGFLEELVQVAQAVPQAGIAGPIVQNWDGVSVQCAGASKIDLWTGSASMQRIVPYDYMGAGFTEVAMLSGCCFLIKREVIEKIGLLDPAYFAYYEETDYCLRAHRAGFKNLLVTSTSIKHYDGGSVRAVNDFRERQLLRNRFLLVRIHGTIAQCITTVLYVTFFYAWVRCFILVASGKTRRLRGVWQGYRSGLAIMFGLSRYVRS